MDCKNHPGVAAAARCLGCAEAFCDQCLIVVNGQKYCAACQSLARQRVQPPGLPPGARVSAMPEAARTSKLAVASLVLGVLGLFTCGLTAIPGIICGIVAVVRIGNSGGRLEGRGLAVGGLVTSAVLLIFIPLGAAIMLPALARAREAARRASCANNLMQVGLVCKMFANESRGEVYPELSPEAGRLMWVPEQVYPEYLTDTNVLLCPSDVSSGDPKYTVEPLSAIDDQSYCYLGYVVTNDDELAAFAEVYKERTAQGLKFDENLPAPPGRGSMGSDTFYRLREGVERLFAENGADSAAVQSKIPVMWDCSDMHGDYAMEFNHIPGGSNVVFMDGHVEFVKYPGKWPMTKEAGEILADMDAATR